ncbi:hypothetical protein OB2597_19726 [Pseudooceanicola batsensis HTCC2597]|uniref:Uncharacterized protein n=1 Tax=Pseudooceanicola batsensis (strain ATCC BAA-863 / DSM 15984 / KCTC 12145 / HTCC2597) TaxID=252305 RepID=A3U0Q5_PSEBH|nr:hypothetical protein OB2597_19726 [Pseudooceanicola batsensis HTCC2597]
MRNVPSASSVDLSSLPVLLMLSSRAVVTLFHRVRSQVAAAVQPPRLVMQSVMHYV